MMQRYSDMQPAIAGQALLSQRSYLSQPVEGSKQCGYKYAGKDGCVGEVHIQHYPENNRAYSSA